MERPRVRIACTNGFKYGRVLNHHVTGNLETISVMNHIEIEPIRPPLGNRDLGPTASGDSGSLVEVETPNGYIPVGIHRARDPTTNHQYAVPLYATMALLGQKWEVESESLWHFYRTQP